MTGVTAKVSKVEPFSASGGVSLSMKTKTTRMKSWNKLTQVEKEARVRSIAGKYAGLTGGVEAFLREKHEEIEREERRYQKLHPDK